MTKRLQDLTALFDNAGIDALLLTNPVNLHYLVGFGDDSFLLVSKEKSVLVTDSRYTEDAGKKVTGAEIYTWTNNHLAEIATMASDIGIKKLGFESEHVTFATHQKMLAAFSDFDLISTEGLPEKLRLIKTPEEVELIRSATKIADKSYLDILKLLTPGITEYELSTELKYRMMKHGAEKDSFPPIIAFDDNASLPHAVPSNKVLTANSLIQFDWGSQYKHYCSDCSRVVFFGKVPSEIEKIYGIVIEANARARDALKPGVPLKTIDAIARDHIKINGYGKFFGHGLGHGVGLDVHESPRLNPKSTDIATPGMMLTVEAGIYLPGIGGIRVEDLMVVTEDGIDILTELDRAPRGLL